jgi:hypothetical protein
MSKLTTFINKPKTELHGTYIGEFKHPVGVVTECVLGFSASWWSHICSFDEITFFNKEEKIIETSDKVYIIISFENEDYFWKKLEENVNVNNEQT